MASTALRVGDVMRIRAYAIMEAGGTAAPFEYDAVLGAQDALVRITHRTIARGDVQAIDNDWGDTRFPLVPSHEMLGVVEWAGPRVTHVRPGDRVGIGYQLGACFECTYCMQGLEQFCPRQTVVSVNAYGGLADHVVVDGRFAFAIPPELDSPASTPLFSSGLTVYAGIRYANLSSRARVAVFGVGGLGSLALRFLVAMGHTVSGLSHSPEKREMVEHLGGEFVDSSRLEELTECRGTLDFILSTLNVPFDLNACLRLLKPEGQLCLVASPLQPLSLSAGLLYDYGRRRIYGNYVGSRSDTVRMLELAAAHRIQASVAVMPFSRVNEAIDRIRNREVLGGLVLESGA
jgi:D-arabinose 1-dehydrogenase-like Zn-dependent alcohol dehydrogenase